jgi:hypothetical protein
MRLLAAIILFSTTISYSFAETIDCLGEAYDLPVYISTNPVAPYDQFVNKSCGQFSSVSGDFYFVANANPKRDSQVPCKIGGDMWGMKTISRVDDGKTLEFLLRFGRNAMRSLKIEKSTGHGALFNISPDGSTILVSKTLDCKRR